MTKNDKEIGDGLSSFPKRKSKTSKFKIQALQIFCLVSFPLLAVVVIFSMHQLDDFLEKFASLIVTMSVGIGALSISYKEYRGVFISSVIAINIFAIACFMLSYTTLITVFHKKITASILVCIISLFFWEVIKIKNRNTQN